MCSPQACERNRVSFFRDISKWFAFFSLNSLWFSAKASTFDNPNVQLAGSDLISKFFSFYFFVVVVVSAIRPLNMMTRARAHTQLVRQKCIFREAEPLNVAVINWDFQYELLNSFVGHFGDSFYILRLRKSHVCVYVIQRGIMSSCIARKTKWNNICFAFSWSHTRPAANVNKNRNVHT